MKKTTLLLLTFSIIAINAFSLKVTAELNKHALIIAVGDYPVEGKWKDISSTNDVALIKNALLKQGFPDENIKVILDKDAKKQGIVDELKYLANNVSKGDVVVIHFSGHGQQIEDNKNKDEIDGYDESLIPYDANLYYSESYKGENHLRDDEITTLLNNIRSKLGKDGDILVILDSCHSGTATRGLSQSRGTSVKFEEPGYDPAGKKDEDNFSNIEISDDNNNMASMVVISGASQEELNYEYYDKNSKTSFGSLSYSFSKALSKATPQTTYRALFDMIQVEMNIIAPKQSPQIEGDVDNEIFGGKAVDQKPYFMIDNWVDEKTVVINAGNLMGIFDSTIVEFYEINTPKPTGKPKARGTVVNSSAIQCDIIIDSTLSEHAAKNSWIFVTKQNFGDLIVKVKIDNFKNKQLEDLIIEKCNKLPTIEIVNENPELLIELNSGNSTELQIITPDELLIYTLDITSNNSEKLADMVAVKLKNYGQANLLKAIELQDPDLNVTFSIIPVTVKRSGSGWVVDKRLSIDTKLKNGNQLEFKDGDTFKIKVKNDGNIVAYYQIIDIQANNNINILIPEEHRTAAEYIIYPGKEKEQSSIFIFGAPYGTEIFKLIATRDPIDLSMIVSTRGESNKRGENSPFEQLFADSYKQTRAGTLSMPPSSANVFSMPFKVVK